MIIRTDIFEKKLVNQYVSFGKILKEGKDKEIINIKRFQNKIEDNI